MAPRDIYGTGFDEDVQADSSTNQCPECGGHVTTNIQEIVCDDCGLVSKSNASITGRSGGHTMRTSGSGPAHR